MGISLAGIGAFDYNRFDSLDEAYRSLYESKEEDDVSDEEEAAIKDEVKKHKKDMHSDDEDDDESEEDEDEKDSEKSDKKFPSFLKKSKDEKVEESVTDKGDRLIDAYDRPPYSDDEDKRDPKKLKFKGKLPKGTVKEAVIDYLLDEGFVNNEVSAEVFIEHMSDEWLEEILEGYKDLPTGKMIRKAGEIRARGEHPAGRLDTRITSRKRVEKMAKVADEHDKDKVRRREAENRGVDDDHDAPHRSQGAWWSDRDAR